MAGLLGSGLIALIVVIIGLIGIRLTPADSTKGDAGSHRQRRA